MSCECELNYEYHEFVDCITSALDARDPYTGNHSRRVSDMACFMCMKLGLSDRESQEIHIAGHFYGIGKIGVPDRVLLKPGNARQGVFVQNGGKYASKRTSVSRRRRRAKALAVNCAVLP